MGWHGYKDLQFASERERIEFVLKDLYGERCRLVDYEKVPISLREQRRDGVEYQSEWYLAVDFSKQYPQLGTGAVLLLERFTKSESVYKPIEEDMGPFAFRCPMRILDKLTASSNEQAQQWRASCRAYQRQKEPAERKPRRRPR